MQVTLIGGEAYLSGKLHVSVVNKVTYPIGLMLPIEKFVHKVGWWGGLSKQARNIRVLQCAGCAEIYMSYI